jgi:hypothetical protein
VKVAPAIVSVPVRAAPVLASTVYLTVPPPVPLLPLVIVIQFVEVVAVHAHPDCVVTVTGPPLPPSFGNDSLVGAMVYVHPELCVMVTVCPATVSVAVRSAPVFGCTV